MFGDFARDMKHGARLLRRSPSFSIIAILTLSISIGAAIATFSIVDAWLLKPLSFPEANRLVIAFAATRERPTEPAIFIPFRNYVTWQEHSR